MLTAESETNLLSFLRRYKRMYLVGGLGTIGLGVVFAALVHFTARHAKPGATALTFGMFLLLGIGLCVPALFDPRKSKVMRLLHERDPSAIVWSYIFDLGGRNQQGAGVVICFDDGETARATVLAKEADAFLAAIAALAPHATLHWTEADAARFAANPRTLRRAVA